MLAYASAPRCGLASSTGAAHDEIEKAALFIVKLAAALHDIADGKFNGEDDTGGPQVWLKKCSASKRRPILKSAVRLEKREGLASWR